MTLDHERFPILGREPSTLHEHFRVDNLGCTSYQQFCRLMDAFGSLEEFLKKWHGDGKTIAKR